MVINMNIEQYFKTYLKTHPFQAWTEESACLLHGAQELCTATGEEAYAAFLKAFGECALAAAGEENGLEQIWESDFLAALDCARSLFFLYEKTGKEAYRDCLERFYGRLAAQPRCACGNFLRNEGERGKLSLDALSLSQPFYMRYETTYHKKECYHDIIRQFENAGRYLYETDTGQYRSTYTESDARSAEGETAAYASARSMGRYLAALVDVAESTSIEIYEQYRKLQDMYRQALKGLPGQRATDCAQSEPSLCFATDGTQERIGNALIAYSALKACRNGMLLAEKYEPFFRTVAEQLTAEQPAGEPEEVGALMMAYAQCLR